MFGNSNNQGIVYHILYELMREKQSLSISMLEVYKESIFDLLAGSSKDLRIKEDSLNGFYVERLSKIVRSINYIISKYKIKYRPKKLSHMLRRTVMSQIQRLINSHQEVI
jgi:hypothetical protein